MEACVASTRVRCPGTTRCGGELRPGGGRGFDSGALSGHHPARCGGELRPGGVRVSAYNRCELGLYFSGPLCFFTPYLALFSLFFVGCSYGGTILRASYSCSYSRSLKKACSPLPWPLMLKMSWSTGLNDGGEPKKRRIQGRQRNLKKTQRTNLKISQR